VDPATGLRPFHARTLAFALGLKGEPVKAAAAVITDLYRAFEAKDCSLAEINPLVVTGDGRVLALDAKLTFDDNALFRHPEVQALRDRDEESPLEVEASRFNLNYIKLDGTVGCMVNGAGLAMATMDIIKLAGGEPANFLDVGGGASAEQIENAFRILISDPSVKAVRTLRVALPIVIRMEGTNVELGQQMLRESRLNFIAAQGMQDAAQKAVRATRTV
jgi:succinyl-CoA synthetase beta subunit